MRRRLQTREEGWVLSTQNELSVSKTLERGYQVVEKVWAAMVGCVRERNVDVAASFSKRFLCKTRSKYDSEAAARRKPQR